MNRNFEVLSKMYRPLAEELKKPEAGAPGGEDGIRLEATPSGNPTLLLGGRYVHSPRDPVREAERLAGALPGDGPIVILGFGLGYAAEAAARTGRPLIIAESRRALFRRALEARDLSSFLAGNTLAFVVGGGGESAIQGALGLFASGDPPALIRNRTLMAADEVWYAGVERGIRAYAGRSQVNGATLRRFGRRWVRNLGRNMEAIRDLPGIAGLKGILGGAASAGGIPVFLAAAGPSLDQAAPLLGEIRKRCVMVAVDTSLRFLLRRGLAPDFAVSVDPQYWNFRHLDRCPAPGTWLVTEPAVYPPTLRHPFRGVFLCRSHFPLGRFIEDRVDPKGPLGAGGSVATSAWDFARFLGAPSVWIAGLDLSFPGLKTHFKGALFENRSHGESGRFVPAETWGFRVLQDGKPFSAPAASGTVLTDRRLSLYASWFAAQFRASPAPKNYRLGTQGLAIPGLESARVEAVLELPERRNEIDALLEGICGKIRGEFSGGGEERARRYREAREKLLTGLKMIGAEAAGVPAGKGPDAGFSRRLDAALCSINAGEVRDVAAFLLPPEFQGPVRDPAEGTPARPPEISEGNLRALAEAAEFQVKVLEGWNRPGSKDEP
jgi:hypothetical protein